MESCRKPKRGEGERNVFCFYYGECLDEAIDREWGSWECSRCLHRKDRRAAPEMQLSANHAIAYYDVGRKI